jgi:hypothetical protein
MDRVGGLWPIRYASEQQQVQAHRRQPADPQVQAGRARGDQQRQQHRRRDDRHGGDQRGEALQQQADPADRVGELQLQGACLLVPTIALAPRTALKTSINRGARTLITEEFR